MSIHIYIYIKNIWTYLNFHIKIYEIMRTKFHVIKTSSWRIFMKKYEYVNDQVFNSKIWYIIITKLRYMYIHVRFKARDKYVDVSKTHIQISVIISFPKSTFQLRFVNNMSMYVCDIKLAIVFCNNNTNLYRIQIRGNKNLHFYHIFISYSFTFIFYLTIMSYT